MMRTAEPKDMRQAFWLWITKSGPRQSIGWILALGAVSSLALPPASLMPVLWLVLPIFHAFLSKAKHARQAFFYGWCFAFAQMVFGFYWIAAALFVEIERFFWMVPITVAGLPALLAIYYGLAAILWRRFLAGGPLILQLLGLAGLFGLADFARGHVFTGFPWNLLGYGWIDWLPVAQFGSLVGIYALSLLTMIVALLPALWLARHRLAGPILALSFIGLGAIALWGQGRLNHAPTDTNEPHYVRLVQPNIAQNLKWDRAQREQNFMTLLELSTTPTALPIKHIIWPETALPFDLERDATRRSILAAALPTGTRLLTGMIRREFPEAGGKLRYFNSLMVFASDGALLAHYDKFHLVPFGEYVPFQGFAPIAAVSSGLGAFNAGTGPQTLTLEGFPSFSPLICYEVIFPAAVKDPAAPPQMLVNITNDAWYGRTAGPYQHLAISQMRAVEEGVPLLRAGNTGISAVIDAQGRILQKLPLGAKGVLDMAIPSPLSDRTLYSRLGDLIFWLLLGVIFATCLFGCRARPSQLHT
jgi:apolipoprotein N-acyltransferase